MPTLDPANFDRFFRVLICGSSGVGKKTLLKSFCTDGDGEDTWASFVLDGEKILVVGKTNKMWRKEFYHDYDAVAVVFATDDVFSFEYALEVMNEMTRGPPLPTVVIENKIDVVESTEMRKEDVESAMHDRRKRLYRVSASKEFNVMHPFAYLLERLTRYKKDENANERKHSSPVESIRLGSREGWPEIPATGASRKSNKDRCIVM
ncbi:unnamed protein product [Caenorhabditis auriculariae]|uniref:Uncharacterized protein n=1 Tax=Caenorhabditis auriculariae TaxID=2777116 RepID=A0A8S1HJ16_9PELO|nr:unnamed protein product [Caenorhabditis auriculariae]